MREMGAEHLTDYVGYLASLILMVSFTMKNLTYLRVINSFACLSFIIYGFMLATAWPVILSNSFVLGVNLYYLWKTRGSSGSAAS